MRFYSFHSLDPNGAIALSQKLVCKDDLDALAEGIRRSVGHAIEIFRGDRLVARVKRDNVPLNSRDLRSL